MMESRIILIAEDDPLGRELLGEILRSAGYAVVEAGDGAEAVSAYEAHPPDLAILDIQMPKLDGFQVLQRLRRLPGAPRRPLVAVSAHALQGDRERALALGFDEYMTKPLEIALLRQRIAELLDTGK
ncbi:MAG: response regulator [Terriglobales bacterium]